MRMRESDSLKKRVDTLEQSGHLPVQNRFTLVVDKEHFPDQESVDAECLRIHAAGYTDILILREVGKRQSEETAAKAL